MPANIFANRFELLRQSSGLQNLDPDLLLVVLISIITHKNIVVTTDNSESATFVERWLELLACNILGVDDVLTIPFRKDTEWLDVERSIMVETERHTRYQESLGHQRGVNNTNNSGGMKKYCAQTLPRFVILKDLNLASREIQSLLVQGMLQKKVTFNNAEYAFPSFSIMICLLNLQEGKSNGVEGLMPHLRDLFFFSHNVNVEDSLNTSLTKAEIAQLSKNLPDRNPAIYITPQVIEEMSSRIDKVTVTSELKVYMQDIVVFLRTHRLIQPAKGCVSPKAVKDFDMLLRAMCVFEQRDFATPSLVAKAARKIFPLKIDMCRNPEDEPTLHYGSDIRIVSKWMKKWDVVLIIDDVLSIVPTPL